MFAVSLEPIACSPEKQQGQIIPFSFVYFNPFLGFCRFCRVASQGTEIFSEKGAVSVYGLGRFPVTLYKEQWSKLLDMAEDIRVFITEHDRELKTKEG